MNQPNSKWEHPGGKLIELGPASLTPEELVAILIGTGYKGRSAMEIAKDLFDNFYSFYGLLGKTPADLLKIKGLKNGKIKRIAAAYEIAKRIIKENNWNLPGARKITLELPDLSDAELLAVLIVNGYKNKTPVDLANELLKRYSSINGIMGKKTIGSHVRVVEKNMSLCGIMGKKLSDMAKIRGLGDVKVVRIAAAYEIARRVIILLERWF